MLCVSGIGLDGNENVNYEQAQQFEQAKKAELEVNKKQVEQFKDDKKKVEQGQPLPVEKKGEDKDGDGESDSIDSMDERIKEAIEKE